MSAAVQYSAALQLIFSVKGTMPLAVNELVSSWREWNGFAVESLHVMPPEQALQTFLAGRRTTPMWLEGYGYKLQWPGKSFGYGNYIRMTSQPCSAYRKPFLIKTRPNPSKWSSQTTADPRQPPLRATAAGWRALIVHSVVEWTSNGRKLTTLSDLGCG